MQKLMQNTHLLFLIAKVIQVLTNVEDVLLANRFKLTINAVKTFQLPLIADNTQGQHVIIVSMDTNWLIMLAHKMRLQIPPLLLQN